MYLYNGLDEAEGEGRNYAKRIDAAMYQGRGFKVEEEQR